jgi:RES domain-containing protein
MTLVSYMIDCEDIFDPSDIESAVRYGIGAEDLGCSDWFAEMTAGRTPRSQEVAEELFNIGFAGMIYPSFVRNAPIGSRNIVLWQWGGEKPYMVKALDPEGVLLRKGADAEAIKS